MKKTLNKVLSFILSLAMVISLTTVVSKNDVKAVNNDDFATMVLIDAGRGYYTVDQIKEIIDQMATSNYEYLMLGFGNDGLRFILDDMSVTADNKTYNSEIIKNAIIAKNDELAPNAKGQWSESDMDTIISYATSKGISIVPLLNTPGHATSITAAMTALGLNAALENRNNSTDNGSTTFDITNTEVVSFATALVQKYINYFQSKGCTYFNLGMDEFAGNNGGWSKMSAAEKTALASYLATLCTNVADANMTPLAFCDVIGNISSVPSNLVGINWNGGYLKNNPNMNANYNWYYVLGATGTGWAGYDKALNYTARTPVTTTLGGTANAGSILAIWNDNYLAADNYITNIKNLIASQSTNNPTYFTAKEIITDPTDDNKYDQEITLTVGESKTETIANANYSNNVDRTNLNTDIATVTVTGQDEVAGVATATAVNRVSGGSSYYIQSSDGKYLNASGQFVDNAANAAKWTANRTSYKGIVTYKLNNGSKYMYYDNGWTTANSSNGASSLFFVNGKFCLESTGNTPLGTPVNLKVSASTPTSTTINFTGVTAGTTYVTVGETTYKVVVSKKTDTQSIVINGKYTVTDTKASTAVSANTDVATVSYSGNLLTINAVGIGETTVETDTCVYTITVTAEDLSKVNLTYYPFISDFAVYPEGTGASNCSGTEGTGNAQTISAALDGVNSEDGISMSDIAWETGDWRWEDGPIQTVYWKGVLHTSSDTQQVGTKSDLSLSGTDFKYIRYYGGTWAVSNDRVNWTDVDTSTDEVCTYYLQKTDITNEVTTYVKDWAFTTDQYSSYSSRDHKALSFAVVYPDGQMSPSADNIYADSTLIYWDTTGVTSDTDTMMIRIGTNEIYEVSKITYTFGKIASESSTSGSLSWDETTTADGSTWYDETTYWDDSMTTEPTVKTNDFLTYDDNAFDASGDAMLILIYLKPVITEDSLTVRYVDDTTNTEFLNYVVNVTNTSTEEKGTFLNRLKQTSPVKTGEFTLDTNAYVVNAKGTKETFQKDTTQIPSLMDTVYASGLYEYVKAEISEDGKTLTLHYTLKEVTGTKDYVVDFGLPIVINASDLTDANLTMVKVTVGAAKFGKTSLNGNKITYTPNEILTGVDTFNVYFGSTKNNVTVKVYPATTVYYEEGFATYTGNWTGTDSKGNGTQTTSPAKESKADNAAVYGYDVKYANENGGPSNGTQATSTAVGDKAEFTFTGTGIDIYANTTTSSGRTTIVITNSAGKVVKFANVNTVMKNGTTNGTEGQEVNGYNEPIYSITSLERGTYTVKIAHAKATTDTTVGALNIDGFRVYGTLSTDNTVYINDLEDNPNYIELRNKVLTAYTVDANGTKEQVYKSDESADQTTVSIITDKEYDSETIQDLLTNGPKNELYLLKGQSITFKVDTKRVVEVGMHGVNGKATYKVNNGNEQTASTTDMFYKVSSGKIVITNTGDNILAITKIKVCDEVTLSPLSENDIDQAITLVNTPVVENADANLTIKLVDYTNKTLATASLTATGAKGEKNVFTTEEIMNAVNTVLPTNYGVAKDATEVTVVYGEDNTINVLVGKVATLKVTYKKSRTVVGTATLTAVQTSSSKTYTFKAADIIAAAPAGYKVSTTGKSVRYGSTVNASVTVR